MSRVGNALIPVPVNVKVTLKGQEVAVEGPRGQLFRTIHPDMQILREGEVLKIVRPTDRPQHKALHGLTRALVANMVRGVGEGFQKVMELRGVGYRAEATPDELTLQLGYSHPVKFPLPKGILVAVQTFTPTQANGFLSALITLSGHDRQALGDFCAEVRKQRPVEPYKGKGLRYSTEIVRKKLGKAAKAGDKKGF